MLVIPAIDLYDGKVVRLVGGDPTRSTVYSDDPIAIANRWKDQGAELIHLVDLSAAFGKGDNLAIIEKLLEEVDIKFEIGGGIRGQEKAKKLIELGAERIIIGTKGIDEEFLTSLIKAVGSERLAVGVDAINLKVAVAGWQQISDWKALDFIEHLKGKGVKWVIYTDISRDGMLSGPNLEEAKRLFSFSGLNFILSGGVSCLEDIRQINQELTFIKGVIVGKALYEGNFSLSAAIACL